MIERAHTRRRDGATDAGAGRAANLPRRLVTVPVFLSLAALSLIALPLAAPLAAATDLVRRRPWPALRTVLFLTFYLLCEAAGIVASAAVWADALRRGDAGSPRYREVNLRLQWWWATTLLRGAQRIFAMRVVVAGEDAVRTGPFFLFPRHVSVGDTILPAALISARHRLRLRYVLKRELLWDPCLDIVGHRVPNYFVRRGSGEAQREAAAVRRLGDGLGDDGGVLLYPEGTRSTAAKRERACLHLEARGDSALAARARRLRHLLPPRLGGALALLQGHPQVDVVFCAHAGFEGARTFADLLAGSLVGRTIRVAFWRVAAADIPRGAEALADWLFAEWERMDAWVDEQLSAAPAR